MCPNHRLVNVLWGCFVLLGLFQSPLSRAQTWDGGGADDNWSTAGNWSPNGVPLNNGSSSLTFAGNSRLTPNVDTPWSIGSLVFDNTAGPFVLGGQPLTIGPEGVTNNSSATQT